MPLVTLHLYNSQDHADEVIVNTDHIVSAEPANNDSLNIQLTAGNPFRATESADQLRELIAAPSNAVSFPALETKDVVVETPAEKKARLKAEADAAAAQ